MNSMIKKLLTSAKQTTYDAVVPHTGNNGRPHLLHPGTLVAAALIVVAVGIGIFSVTDPGNHTRLKADVYAGLLIDLTNRDRSEESLPQLIKNDKLVLAAQLKAQDMAEKGYFAHTSPEGIDSWYWFQRAGYTFLYAGENLAVDFTQSEDVADAWMNSPTHKANILNNRFSEIGIATHDGMYKGKKTTFVVQMFGTPQVFAGNPTTTTPPKTVSDKSVPTEKPTSVLGKTTVIEQTTGSTNSMIVGKNATATESEPTEPQPVSEPVITPIDPVEQSVTYTPWHQKLLIELSHPLAVALLAIGSMLGISFVLSVAYHKTITQRIVFGALVVFAIIFSGYIYLSISREVSPLLVITESLQKTTS